MKPLPLLVLLFVAVFLASAQAEKPNIVVFLTDDQGWGDLSLNGNTNLSTPNIDSLARDGASFERFFVCPVCSPTRAEFLTGRYHPYSGVYSTSAGGERMDLEEVTIADSFKAAGYATGAFGKWHNGMQYPYHPLGRGFEEFYGFCSGHWGDYFDSPILEHNGQIVQGEGFIIDDCTNKAMTFMESQVKAEKPFFAYLPYNTPHSPMQVPDEFWGKFAERDLAMRNRDPKKEDVPHTRAALAMCENIDWNVGRVLDKLDTLGIADNTIVVFFHDNGPNGVRWNGDMKGKKGSTDEGGVRSPLLIRWPTKIDAGLVIPQIAGAIDLHPTLASLAGIEPVNEMPFTGLSLQPLLTGKGEEWPSRILIHHWRNRTSARNQQYRLDTQWQLFDLVADPGQRTNVAEQHPQVVQELVAAVDAFESEITGYDDDQRPFIIGHPDFPFSQIPARDGIPQGSIERSNKFPNDSHFRNWTSTEDAISWNVEVLESGNFEVRMWYAVAKTDVGARLELSLGQHKLEATVVDANEVPLAGMGDDRVERKESYVKDWKPMALGTIHLEKGPGELKLRALEIPGEEALEFRLLMLTRQE